MSSLRESGFGRSFAGSQSGQARPTDLNALPQDVVEIVIAQTRGRVSIEVVRELLPQAVIQRQQIIRVLLDIVQNALDSVGESGWVRVATRRVSSHLEIIVEDNGCGLAAEDLAGVLDPCLRVKSGQVVMGNWSLLGFRQVVARHGGDIRVESLPDVGTSVRLTIPRHDSNEGES